jgi:SAM-dependent methyltransferase
MGDRNLKQTYLCLPTAPSRTLAQKLQWALVGAILSPVYWLLAHRYRAPGLQLRRESTRLGLRLLYTHKAPISYGLIYTFFFWPMDSTRYFEFDFMWRTLSKSSIRRYLDVSSPRLFPLILLRNRRELKADLVNPDTRDLALTANLVKASGLEQRCQLHNCLIEAAPFDPESFDVITSISVVEHIPQDKQAVQKMWDYLTPGGRLLLSVPCAAEASIQYINVNHYGLLAPDKNGYVFLQHIYDQALLKERIFSVTGPPVRFSIYGEKQPGTLRANLDRKGADRNYPYWREPYMMGQTFCYFDSVADLPGEGVIGMEFEKK